MKILSVIVPVYNTEKYIKRCLDSLVYDSDTLNDIEVIVVNDGGTDNSLEVANSYKKKYGDSIVVIDKENRGHGSAINAGFKIAKGKYIKVLDSDDWFNIIDFPKFVAKLKKEKADIVVTNYKRDLIYDEKEINFIFSDREEKIRGISEVESDINDPVFFFRFSMPSMAVRKKALEGVWGEGLLEKTFYVDQQFVEKVLSGSNTFIMYDLDIYRHFIGRPGQSIGASGFYAHRMDHERVLRELLRECAKLEDSSKIRILTKQIDLMLDTHYSIYRDSHRSVNEIKKFDEFLKEKYSDFYKASRMRGIKRRVVRRMK